jgi:hypothetical protein
MPKPKKPIREMHRWEKMMAGATDMEELLDEVLDWLEGSEIENYQIQQMFRDKIETQLKRTGRLK